MMRLQRPLISQQSFLSVDQRYVAQAYVEKQFVQTNSRPTYVQSSQSGLVKPLPNTIERAFHRRIVWDCATAKDRISWDVQVNSWRAGVRFVAWRLLAMGHSNL